MNKKNILLVEDNPSDIDLTRRALLKAQCACELTVVEDGQEALDYIFCEHAYATREKNQLPVLILLDLKLPKIDGLEVLRRIRAADKIRRIPVVILTSSIEEQDILTSYDLGVNSYIRKPVDFHQFSESMKQLSWYWLVINEAPPYV
jgi:two-component system, response regulator